MEQEVQNYYNAYLDLFQQEGWAQFQADVKAAADAINIPVSYTHLTLPTN